MAKLDYVKMQRKSRRELDDEGKLEILKYMTATEDLPLLPVYAENEWLYRFFADDRDKAAGIAVEGTSAWELWLDGFESDVEKIQRDLANPELLERKELLERELCARCLDSP